MRDEERDYERDYDRSNKRTKRDEESAHAHYTTTTLKRIRPSRTIISTRISATIHANRTSRQILICPRLSPRTSHSPGWRTG